MWSTPRVEIEEVRKTGKNIVVFGWVKSESPEYSSILRVSVFFRNNGKYFEENIRIKSGARIVYEKVNGYVLYTAAGELDPEEYFRFWETELAVCKKFPFDVWRVYAA